MSLILVLSFLDGLAPPAKHAVAAGGNWDIQVLDSGLDRSYVSLAHDSGFAIAYWDQDHHLKLQHDRNGDGDFTDAGEIQVVDDAEEVGSWNSVAFGTGVAISYYDSINVDLKFAYDRNGDGDFSDPGEIQVVESEGHKGGCSSLAFGTGPAISHYDDDNWDLRLAYDRNNDGDYDDSYEKWTTPSEGNLGRSSALAFGSGRAISYAEDYSQTVKLAYDRNSDGDFDDDGEIRTVDTSVQNQRGNSLAFGTGPAVVYVDEDSQQLELAYDRDNNGDFDAAGERTIVDTGATFNWPCLAIGAQGPAVAYYDSTNGAIKFAYDLNSDADFEDAGEKETVEAVGAPFDGMYGTLGLTFVLDTPVISYVDHNTGELKLARRTGVSAVVELREQGTATAIDSVVIGGFFDIYVGDSSAEDGIAEVRFSSDDSQDGIATGEWTTQWYNWNVSSGDWNAATKVKAWSFATGGPKEVWAEVKGVSGARGRAHADVQVSLEAAIETLIADYAPILHLHEDELYFPTDFLHGDDDISNNPDEWDSATWPKTAYVHAVMNDDHLCIQYWYYYVNDFKYFKGQPLYHHVHDWESVYIFFSRQGGEYTPEKVTYFGHDDHRTYDWLHPRIRKAGNHVVIYVGKLSHAAFPNFFGPLDTYPLFTGGDPWYNHYPFYEPVGFEVLQPWDMTPVEVDGCKADEWHDFEFGTVEAPWLRTQYWTSPWHFLDEPWGDDPPEWPLSISVHSPAKPLFVDALGRRVGFDPDSGTVVNEIPGAEYTGPDTEPQVIVIPDALAGEHSIVLSGTAAGTYSMDVESYTDEGAVFLSTDIPVTGSTSHEYAIDWSALSQGQRGITIVVDVDGDGESDKRIVAYGDVGPEPFLSQQPCAPTGPSPADGASDLPLDTTLSWSEVGDPDPGDTVTYDIYFGTSSSLAMVAQDLSDNTYDPCVLRSATSYRWRVDAVDNHGVVAEGPVWQFTTICQLDLQIGWNMISVPVQAPDMSTSVIFTGTEAVYTWNPETKSYVTPETIDPCRGYWVAVTENKTITVTGTPVTEWTCDISQGWNMIGSTYGDTLAVSNLITDSEPDPLQRNAIYHWSPGSKSYESASSIVPGEGYWAATTADCELTLSPPA